MAECSELENKSLETKIEEMYIDFIDRFDKMESLLNKILTNGGSEESKQTPPNNSTIPTGGIKIRNVFANKYLAVSSNHDGHRRNLVVMSSPEQWTLDRQADHYRITRRQDSEDLFAPVYGFRYDAQRRRIFTWAPGYKGVQGRWKIMPAPGFPGMVHIWNVHFKEYLMVADFEDRVFSWIPKTAPGNDSHFVWQIEQW